MIFFIKLEFGMIFESFLAGRIKYVYAFNIKFDVDLINSSKVIPGQKYRKMAIYGKLQLNGLHTDHPPA